MTLKVLDGRVLPLGGKIDLPMRGQVATNARSEVATNARSEYMWRVGDVEPVRVMGAEGYPYGRCCH